jgi:enoyl-CoA hydratase
MTENSDIQFRVDGGLGRILLNRPKALNALTHDMCVAMHATMRAWARDPAVSALLIEGAGDRAFCAGGDIRKLYDEGRAGGAYPKLFYGDEYRLNAAVHHFPKPYVAFIDGIVMGGGVGVSINGSHRVVTEATTFAMPETGIGLFPDVGGSYFLARCPGAIGAFLGLTGTRLKAADALYAGLADHYVPQAKLGRLVDALATAADSDGDSDGDGDSVNRIIADFAEDAGSPSLAAHRDAIDRCVAGATVEEVCAALAAEGTDWADKQQATIAAKSPTSLKVALKQIHNGRERSFKDCMAMEWRIVNRVIAGHDFYEGTRAVIIDKDQSPAWSPASLAGVAKADVEAYFAPLDDGDLTFDAP